LSKLPGIGPWTAEYVALRALGEPDAFPATDLDLRHIVSLSNRPLSALELEARAEAWRPWRGYAAVHLWSATADAVQRNERDVVRESSRKLA
jgi:AraC family transcriptional regulator of adaptative response / DNA-3-methyladenine glycosylase II